MTSMRLLKSSLVFGFVLFAAGACDGIGPTAVEDGIKFSLDITPGRVPQFAQFEARLTIENLRDVEVVRGQSMGCPAYVSVTQGGFRRSGFPETDFGCTANITSFRLGPRETVSWAYVVTANAEPGPYTFRVDFTVQGFPPLEDQFTVTEPVIGPQSQ